MKMTYHNSILLVAFALLICLYLAAVLISNRRFKPWPNARIICFILGILSLSIGFIGPLADRAHTDFSAHMLGHLFLGMLAPLLITLSAPMTLILRSLKVKSARRLTKILRYPLVRSLTDPIVAAILNVGGLWLLYTTTLYAAMHHHVLLHVFIHIHVFLAGYLFTASLISIDPMPHRKSFFYRAVVFLIAAACHGILAKFLYGHPPIGVPTEQAEIGSVLMYYGGDVIDSALITILCTEWYTSKKMNRIRKPFSY